MDIIIMILGVHWGYGKAVAAAGTKPMYVDPTLDALKEALGH